jgi:hypothetical protein
MPCPNKQYGQVDTCQQKMIIQPTIWLLETHWLCICMWGRIWSFGGIAKSWILKTKSKVKIFGLAWFLFISIFFLCVGGWWLMGLFVLCVRLKIEDDELNHHSRWQILGKFFHGSTLWRGWLFEILGCKMVKSNYCVLYVLPIYVWFH